MTDRFQLPGAEEFSQHLETILEGDLTADGPEIVDRSYNGEYAKRWVVNLDGNQIGEYLTFGPKPDETEFGREFRGKIPGYRTEDICLTYGNRRFEAQLFHEGPGKLIDTPWQRQDGHDQMPFP